MIDDDKTITTQFRDLLKDEKIRDLDVNFEFNNDFTQGLLNWKSNGATIGIVNDKLKVTLPKLTGTPGVKYIPSIPVQVGDPCRRIRHGRPPV